MSEMPIDKGKPAARPGRRAMGLRPGDRQVAEIGESKEYDHHVSWFQEPTLDAE
jgi:hypothetical protein